MNKLGKYEIRRELGRGAMGIVYEGFDPFIERTVAIKTIQKSLIDKTEAEEILGRFRREAQAAGRLTHPSIVSVYEYGEDGDAAFIAMEFIVGTELKEHFDSTVRFNVRDSANIMIQLLDALEYSHNRGVVHRDIKPSNILVNREGRVKIADFGIAKIESSDLTQVGTVLGTPAYMSPEQFMGQAVDRRSDIYSAGVILYQFLAGERPFTGSNMTDIMHKVMHQAPPSLARIDPQVPEALQRVVEKAMAKQPQDRFQSAAEFMKALQAALEAPPAAIQAVSQDTTLKISKPETGAHKSADDPNLFIDFSAADFDARLRETQQQAERGSGMPDFDEEQDNSLREINMEFRRMISLAEPETETVVAPAPAVVPALQPAVEAESGESDLLAGLAREAKDKLGSQQSTLQEAQARARRVDDALNRIVKFFQPFIRHVNAVEPAINRDYRYDARTVYSGLKWRNAIVEYRRQNLSDAALMEYVTFSVNLCAPEPVPLRRPWGPLETLKQELHHLRLRVLDDTEAVGRKPKQEWLETQLAADFPVQIRFQGDYNGNNIGVMCRNLGSFGITACRLEPGDVTAAFLDSLGLFLLGRSNELPAQLRQT